MCRFVEYEFSEWVKQTSEWYEKIITYKTISVKFYELSVSWIWDTDCKIGLQLLSKMLLPQSPPSPSCHRFFYFIRDSAAALHFSPICIRTHAKPTTHTDLSTCFPSINHPSPNTHRPPPQHFFFAHTHTHTHAYMYVHMNTKIIKHKIGIVKLNHLSTIFFIFIANHGIDHAIKKYLINNTCNGYQCEHIII